jgi:hypothetical protein
MCTSRRDGSLHSTIDGVKTEEKNLWAAAVKAANYEYVEAGARSALRGGSTCVSRWSSAGRAQVGWHL